MSQYFFKYQGTGNDFIVIDDRNGRFPKDNKDLVMRLCDRKFGIGSDGLLLIQQDDKLDFHVDFINPDASRSFCGNGSRCAVSFAALLGMVSGECHFRAIDGEHRARLDGDLVELEMSYSGQLEQKEQSYRLHTGSPHYIEMVKDVSELDVLSLGQSIRYGKEFKEKGINVNFVEILNDQHLSMRTYERGVENETLSCGTGVTAAAIVMRSINGNDAERIHVSTKGGELSVRFETDGSIWLKGPAKKVFSGEIPL